jgi:hypothetical protein
MLHPHLEGPWSEAGGEANALADNLEQTAPEHCALTECHCPRCELIADLRRHAKRLQEWQDEINRNPRRRAV